jgi:ActR/RegA family two-component response regulator
VPENAKLALVVHPDLTMATSLHNCFQQHGFTTVVARDLPTALLMLTQHIFDVAVMSSRIGEEGDGWALAGVLRLVLPGAHVAVIARDKNVLTLRSAINSHTDQLLPSSQPAEEMVASVLGQIPASQRPASNKDMN